jgi:anti-sigma factor RsiW
MESVPYELLVDLAEGRLAPLEAAAVREQVAANPIARRQLAEIEELIGLIRRDEGEDAPEHVIARAMRLLRPPAPQPKLRRLTAILRSDSWRTPGLAPGLRSLQAWPRAILLRAGDHEIDLQVAPRGEQWQLTGQLLGPESPGSVTLSGPADRVTASLNELGEFTLPLVAGGRYSLIITQGDLEIVVPNLEIGPSSTTR